MRITVITWLTTALLQTLSVDLNVGERASKQLFYTTYLYPSSSSSLLRNPGSSSGSSSGNSHSNAFLTPQLSISPLHSFWSSFGDQKGRQTSTLLPVNNANHNQAYLQNQQLLRQQQVLWSPSLPMGTSSFIAAPLQQQYQQHSGLTAAGGSANNNNVLGSQSPAPGKNVKHAQSSFPTNAQFILQSQQQIGPQYQIHPTSSSNALQHNQQGMPIIGYVSVPLNPSYNFWNHPYSSLSSPGGTQSAVQSHLQSGLLSPSANPHWNLPLKSYEQIQNELMSNSISPTGLNQQHQQKPQKKPVAPVTGFQRGQVEAVPVLSSSPNTKTSAEITKNLATGVASGTGGFIRGHIESNPNFISTDHQNILAGIRNAGYGAAQNLILPYQLQQHHSLSLSAAPSTGFNRGAVEHRFPELASFKPGSGSFPVASPQAITYDTPTKNVICYFASWSFYRKREGQFIPENADPTLCTHLIYAFAVLDKSKFAIKESDPFTDNNKCFYQRTIQLKKNNPSLKVLLALGGWSDSGDDKYSTLAHNQVARRKFARESAQFLKDRNFDGMSLDWHYPKCWQSNCEAGPASDKHAFSEFTRELKMVFEQENLILGATLSGYEEVIDIAYDIPALSRSLDFLSIMTYDYHGSWETKTGHVAPLYNGPPASDPYPHYNANYTMEYYASKGADRSKLMLGVPMYGQSFQLSNPGDSGYGSEASGPGLAGEYTNQPGMLSYYEICKRVKDQQWTVQRDITGSWGPYAYKGNQWVGFEDSDSLTRKSRYVKAQGYGGVFVWTIDLDDFGNQCCMGAQPLLRTIAKELLGIPYQQKTDCTKPNVVAPSTESCQASQGPAPGHPTTGTPGTTSSPVWWPTEGPSVSTTTEYEHHHHHQPSPSTTPLYTSTPTENSLSSTASENALTSTVSSTSTELEGTQTSTGSMMLICQQLMGTSTPMQTSTPASSTTPGGIHNEPNSCDNSWLYQADTADCSGYYQCAFGRVSKHRCSYGLHWNRYSNTCDWPSQAKCQDSQDLMLSTTEHIVTTERPPPSMTTSGRPTTTTTQRTTTQYWTPPPSTTTRMTTTTRPPQQQPVQPPQEQGDCISGQYYPGPTCDQFYVCAAGRKQIQACGPGLHWNKDKYLCDWPSNAGCQKRTVSVLHPSHQVRPIAVSDTGPCTEGQYSSDPSDCGVYYICDHGRPVKFRCQSGLYWNNNQKVCDWPSNVACSESPSGGGDTGGGSASWQTTTTTQRPAYSTTTAYTPGWTQATTQYTTTQRPTSGGGSGGSFPPPSSVSGDYMVVCYFTNWAWYRPGEGKYTPDDIDPTLCSHIVYGFAVLDYSTLLMKPHDTWADFDNRFYARVTEYKSKGAKVTLALGGWNDSEGDKYSRLVNNPQARQTFITNAIDFIRKNNFDGLDLDWEYPKCWQVDCSKGPASDKPSFAAFVREIKEAFQPYGLLLSAAVSPSKMVIDEGYDVPTLSRYLDWIAVMTYDYHGQWDKKTGHVAPLYFHEEDDYYYYNANYTMHYWMQLGADRKKLVMGMPTYGQSFTLANPSNNGLNAPTTGGGTAGEFTRASGFLAYYEICKRVNNDQWTVVQDPEGAIGPYAYKGNQWTSYDDVPMIRKKSELIKSMGLAGGMIWALDLDDFRDTCGGGKYPLLTAINSVLGRKRTAPVISGTGGNIISSVMQPTKKPSTVGIDSTMPTLVAYPSVVSVVVHQQELQPIKVNQPDPCSTTPFKPHSNNCRKYYRCIFGKYVEQTCPTGTFWNRDRCDWSCGSDSQQQAHQPQPPPAPTPGTYTTTTQRPTMTTTRWTTSSTTTSKPASSTHNSGQWTWSSSTTEGTPSSTTDWGWKPTISTTTTIHPVTVPETDYKVVCYFTNWAWYRQGTGKYKPEDIDYNLCTHIAYGFAVLDTTTLQIKPHDSWADIDNQFYTQVTKLREKGKKVVIAIGGWNDSAGDKYSKLVSDPAARQRFVKHVVEFIEKWNFDGLDLDWEYPKCWQTECKKGPESDKANFAALCKELSEAFKPKGLLLSSAVSPSKTIIDEGYDVPAVSKYLDWIAVMTYDYHGQWDKKTGHVAPMYHHEESDNFYFNTNYTIHYWISQGADRKKLVMGMPMYGQSFSLADANDHGLNAKSYGGGTAGEFTRAQGFLAYYEICSFVKNKDWKVVHDDTGSIGPYAYQGGQWVSYDDINMIRRKSQYIKDMKLGGGMIWALDLDDFRGVCGCEKHPLLKTINRVLRDYPEPDPQCSI